MTDPFLASLQEASEDIPEKRLIREEEWETTEPVRRNHRKSKGSKFVEIPDGTRVKVSRDEETRGL